MHAQPVSNREFRMPALLLGVFMPLTACTSLHLVDFSDGELQNKVVQGDKVVVTTDDGSMHKFKLIAITDSGLKGEQITIPTSDITTLQVERFDKQKTILLTVGIAVAAAAAAGGGGGGY